MFRTLGSAGPKSPTDLTTYWFCHAGSGPASLVRSARELPPGCSLEVATLPGREGRYSEGLTLSLADIVDQFYNELKLRIDGPYALVGHSFGSLICYLLAMRLSDDGLAPEAITAMTLAAPDRIRKTPKVSGMTDGEFLDYLDQRFGGVPDALRGNPEALGLFLPIVRFDMQMLESYAHVPSEPLSIPITVIGGTDDTAVSRADLEGWRSFTQAAFSMRMMPGDHFFPLQNVEAILDLTRLAATV